MSDGFWQNADVDGVVAALKCDADIEASDDYGWTPLLRAASNNENPAVIQALIDAGADVNVKDSNGITPLHMAARNNENGAVTQALLDGGAEINAENKWGTTPLGLAKAKENVAAIKGWRRPGPGSPGLRLAQDDPRLAQGERILKPAGGPACRGGPALASFCC